MQFGLPALGGLLLNGSLQAEEAKKPNLLFIMTDQQRFDALSLAGNKILSTPNLDRLARQGAWFRNAYTQCAVCAPTRASILTGSTVENHQILTNEISTSGKETGRMSMPTYDELLSRNGYRCEYYGKWHSPEFHTEVYQNPELKAINGKSVFAPGGLTALYMDYLNIKFPKESLQPGELYDTFTARPYLMNPLDKRYGMTEEEVLKLNKKYTQPDLHGVLVTPAEHSFTAFQARQTIGAIERNKNTTFSITCSFHFPHAPMLPVKPYSEMYPVKDMPVPASIADPMMNSPYRSQNGRLEHSEYADPEKIKFMIADYYGLVKEIDDWVGKILEKLAELGLEENTLVIFTSDHGDMLGAHGMREKNVFYEESAHIPLMIRFPGRIKPATTVDGYVSNIDLFATINDYLNIPEYPSDGQSLRGLIEGTDLAHGQYVVTEWLYNEDRTPAYMILKDGWKMFIPYSEESKVINVLYNLKDDPHEMNNLLGNNPDKEKYNAKAEELRNDLLIWLKKHNSKHYEGVKNRNLLGTDLSTNLIDRHLSKFRIYPNPTSQQITIDSINQRIDGICLFNMCGQRIYCDYEAFTGLKTFDLPLDSGIYLVKPMGKYPFMAQKLTVEK
ncbi:MAG TPA: sulfatase-like hydrolase/transferase [Prolixibacteraceae bacterium]|nr:sulfatase-like hydrolase/transferase [Prolixibacteraceae bacterium]